MQDNCGMNEKEKETLKNIICYFGDTIPHLQEVKLCKLVYIAQLYHYSNHGSQLTKLPFVSFSYGPHAPAIKSLVKEQLQCNAIYLEESLTETELAYSNPCLIIRSCKSAKRELSKTCLNTLEEVIEDWRDKAFREILDYTVRTIPFISTPYRDCINLASIQPYRALKTALSLPERIKLHRFVRAPQEAFDDSSDYANASCPVSINEIAEIYLALCGDLPDQVPSPQHLGFSVQAVLETFGTQEEKREDGTEKHLSDIDKAAKLSAALSNAKSFGCHNELVALKTGMLFLKRRNYSFDTRVLQENAPDGQDHKTLKGWLGRVSVKLDSP